MFEELLATSKSALLGVDTYLSFSENRLGRAAVTRLYSARKNTLPGSITLIHGPSGVGKTHLALRTLNELVLKCPQLIYAYATVKELCAMIVHAEERNSLAELLEKFRKLDLLICEDLHWLEQAQTAQPDFLMLIETLEEGMTQVLITSQKPPGEIRPLDQRIVSRCHGGLSVGMPLPRLESRIQLFQHWFRELQLPILKPFVDSARLLAERLPLPPRDLRELVLELARRQRRKPTPIDVVYLERWLSENRETPRLSFETIVLRVAHVFGVNPKDIRSRSRNQGLAIPRQCAMWLSRQLTGRPLEQIGEYFARSHTTVSHSLSRLEELMPSNPSLRQQVQKLRKQLKELPREDCA